eukprot:14345152-Ditylum_brightwellii.AAC.1
MSALSIASSVIIASVLPFAAYFLSGEVSIDANNGEFVTAGCWSCYALLSAKVLVAVSEWGSMSGSSMA